jgi:2-polyprenyl-3-methyl-5-hydroxy-6-metoxy-1,4-benzoquinol methylase
MSTRETWEHVWSLGGEASVAELHAEVEREERRDRAGLIREYVRGRQPSGRSLKVVELGAGSAIYSVILARLGAEVTAVDQSAEALARAGQRASAAGVALRLVEEDAVAFSAAHAGEFDVAMSFGTVEHFREPLRTEMCRAHARAVRPGGAVILETPNLLFLPHEALKRLLMLRKKWFLGYEGSFTRWEMRRMARLLGLVDIREHGTSAYHDTLRYARIVGRTRLFGRIFPWARAINARREALPEDGRPGPLGRRLDAYLGMNIMMMGRTPD